MSDIENRRRKKFANKLHRDIFILIFLASLLPALLVTICLYYLIFNITASQIGFPEGIAYNIIPAARKVTHVLLVAAPGSILVILVLAYKMTHRIVGPFDRIIRELDESIKGQRQGPIILRKNDKFSPLVEKINSLLDKLSKK